MQSTRSSSSSLLTPEKSIIHFVNRLDHDFIVSFKLSFRNIRWNGIRGFIRVCIRALIINIDISKLGVVVGNTILFPRHFRTIGRRRRARTRTSPLRRNYWSDSSDSRRSCNKDNGAFVASLRGSGFWRCSSHIYACQNFVEYLHRVITVNVSCQKRATTDTSLVKVPTNFGKGKWREKYTI